MIARAMLIVLTSALAGLHVQHAAAQSEDVGLPEIKPTKRTSPRYPTTAMDYQQPGNVRVRVTIDAAGTPTAVDVLTEIPADYRFGRAAVDSVEDWKFEPGIAGVYTLKVNFRLDPPEAYPKEGVDIDAVTALAPPPIEYVPPVYPLLAQELKLEAVVRVIVVLKNGRVTSAGVVRDNATYSSGDSFSIFGNSAYIAIMDWEFDEALSGTYRVMLPFTLDGLAKGMFRAKPQRS